MPAGMTHQQVEDQMVQAAKVDSPMTEAMPSGTAASAIVARGTFANSDSFHKSEGTATVYRVGQEIVLRLDPFKVTNGPALHAYLSGRASPRNSAELHASGALDLGKLRGNIGAQKLSDPGEHGPLEVSFRGDLLPDVQRRLRHGRTALPVRGRCRRFSLTGSSSVAAVAFVVPLPLGSVPRLRLLSVVLEILVGITTAPPGSAG